MLRFLQDPEKMLRFLQDPENLLREKNYNKTLKFLKGKKALKIRPLKLFGKKI